MAFRLVEELTTRYDIRVTAIVPAPGRQPGATASAASPASSWSSPSNWTPDARTGRHPDAAAIGLIEQDDSGNIDAALLAQELNPEVRIVVRMFNVSLGYRIAGLLNDCVVLSAAEIAAPVFVAAALDESATPDHNRRPDVRRDPSRPGAARGRCPGAGRLACRRTGRSRAAAGARVRGPDRHRAEPRAAARADAEAAPPDPAAIHRHGGTSRSPDPTRCGRPAGHLPGRHGGADLGDRQRGPVGLRHHPQRAHRRERRPDCGPDRRRSR